MRSNPKGDDRNVGGKNKQHIPPHDSPAIASDLVSSAPPQGGSERFIYTHHARERMAQRGANDNEVEDTVLTGEEVPARDGKQKFEKLYDMECIYQGKTYGRKKVEVVTARDDDDWVIVTVIADCKR